MRPQFPLLGSYCDRDTRGPESSILELARSRTKVQLSAFLCKRYMLLAPHFSMSYENAIHINENIVPETTFSIIAVRKPPEQSRKMPNPRPKTGCISLSINDLYESARSDRSAQDCPRSRVLITLSLGEGSACCPV